ncbi:hypothetical protein BGZ83_006537 [Gryganskiella cystojenkinii]|nr:hypothetical protein BGZ83_006537 [Gryganskiella cystojenkinii]
MDSTSPKDPQEQQPHSSELNWDTFSVHSTSSFSSTTTSAAVSPHQSSERDDHNDPADDRSSDEEFELIMLPRIATRSLGISSPSSSTDSSLYSCPSESASPRSPTNEGQTVFPETLNAQSDESEILREQEQEQHRHQDQPASVSVSASATSMHRPMTRSITSTGHALASLTSDMPSTSSSTSSAITAFASLEISSLSVPKVIGDNGDNHNTSTSPLIAATEQLSSSSMSSPTSLLDNRASVLSVNAVKPVALLEMKQRGAAALTSNVVITTNTPHAAAVMDNVAVDVQDQQQQRQGGRKPYGKRGARRRGKGAASSMPLTQDREERVRIRLANAEKAALQAQQSVFKAREQLERSKAAFKTAAAITRSFTAAAIAKASTDVAEQQRQLSVASPLLSSPAANSSTNVLADDSVVVDWSSLSLSLHQRQSVRCWFVRGFGYDSDKEKLLVDGGSRKKRQDQHKRCTQDGRRTHYDLCGQHWNLLQDLAFGHVEQLRSNMTLQRPPSYQSQEQPPAQVQQP